MPAYEADNQRWSEVITHCDIAAWEIDPGSLTMKFSSYGQEIFKLRNTDSISLSAFLEKVQSPYIEVLSNHFGRLTKESKPFFDTIYLNDLTCIRIKGREIHEGSETRFIGTVEIIYSNDQKKPLASKLGISEGHYKLFFDFNPMPIFIWEYDTLKIVDCNNQALIKYGYSKEEFLNLNIKDIRPSEEALLVNSFIIEELKDKGGHHRVCRHVTKSGEIFIAKVLGYYVNIDGNNCSMELITDFTDQFEGEQQLLESVNELSDYRFALDESCLVMILNHKQKVEYLNLKFQEVSGYQYQEIVGDLPNAVYEENEALKDCLDAVTEGKIWRGELKGLKSNGGVFWVDTVITPFKNSKGKTYQYIWVGYDITEKKQAEESLFKERFLLRTIIDNLPIHIYVKDINGKHIVNNKFQYENFLSATSEEVTLGKTVFDYFPEEVANRMAEIDRQIIEGGQSSMNLEEYYYDANGKITWLLTNKVALRDASGKVVGLVGMTKDVTDRKHEEETLKNLNQELIKKARELEQSNEELEQFAYIASHDLQEPLRMITGFLSLLEKNYSDVLDERGAKYMYFVVDGATRMKAIIMDLLTYSRVGRMEEKIKETDLAAVVSDVLNLQQTLISQKGAEITVGPLPTLRIPVSPIIQVFQNLINNSLKYQADGVNPKISVSAKEKDAFWEFYVKDNGIGIPESSKDKVFILFSRLHSKSKYSGTGIGLAMCKKIIENLGGSIGFQSKDGAGSTFYFTVPKVLS
ncbi:PAS domain S-box protein [Cyclobacterium qasimii]|uniref:histidine kinase n=1 Tax=Cyclobacterium qasimii TaxID=1350429 RepID=A0A512CGC5_9BACT|nr:PAS domain S-box protein [Cyclobacterium qasimii]GEO23281.1 hypothetical protein CQA01_38150 [Cyclobacterium qasimii]